MDSKPNGYGKDTFDWFVCYSIFCMICQAQRLYFGGKIHKEQPQMLFTVEQT